jgi:hypothetical protein
MTDRRQQRVILDLPRNAAVWDPSFRQRFCAKWGRENAVISARTRRVEYPDYRQLLSIKAAIGGTEHYFVDGRHRAVDDDTFLILNAGHRCASRIDEANPVHTFSIFFEPRLAEEVLRALTLPAETLLDNPPDDVGCRHSPRFVNRSMPGG